MRRFSLIAILAMGSASAFAQAPMHDPMPAFQPTIDGIAALEARRDPKCYATASRLEDFMYGTPLCDESRFTKIDLQKELLLVIWRLADQQARAAGHAVVDAATVEPTTQSILPRTQHENLDWEIASANNETLLLTERDVRQYGNVAYGLRAILAVQQERLFVEGEDLLPLSDDAVDSLKVFLDIYTLAALQIADREARANNQFEISAEGLVSAWGTLGHAPEAVTPAGFNKPAVQDVHALTRKIIAQKIASYEAYNQIAMPVFSRNIQVYFARHRWPSDPAASDALKAGLTEVLIDFAVQLLDGAEATAAKHGHDIVHVTDVSEFVHGLVPHQINEFEDATFFPALPREQQVYIEAYDMDAFRDGGLHWRYLEAALDEPQYTPKLPPDPFALELITENIAQFGVLVLRLAGADAIEKGYPTLQPENLQAAVQDIQARISSYPAHGSEAEPDVQIASSAAHTTLPGGSRYFTEVTADTGVNMEHRSADWLSRLIRSYAIRDGEVAVLAVPPAFGGSGAAAEDLNDDGYLDLLLLSGTGNRLFVNNQDGTFRDVTSDSGLDWIRPDGTHGEPRQPIIADFDNDGVQDIVITYVNDAHRIYKGAGDARYEDVTAKAGLGGEGLVGGPATALDFDKDGLLDLYIGYFGQYTEGILPTLARVNTNGLPNKLFRNKGDFAFEDVTVKAGVAGNGWTQAVAHTDFNADGWQDIIEGNDFGTNPWYRNNGDGTFTDVSTELGTDKPSYTMGFGVGDLNADFVPDIYVSNIVTMDKDQKYVDPGDSTRMKFDPDTMATMRVVEANDLFVSQPSNSYIQSKNIDRGRAVTGWSWGADFFDFDNDGDDDLYVSNGMNEFAVYSTENPYYRDPEGNERDVVFPQSSREHNVLFINEDGMLRHAADTSGADLLGNTRAVVHADIDRDGDLDLILNNYHEAAVIYRNNSDALNNNWLQIRLKGDPTRNTSADAIGAVIVVTTPGGRHSWREVHSGSGYLTSHPKTQTVGLGDENTATIEVRWPDGSIDRFTSVPANRRVQIAQSDASLIVLE